MAEVVRSIKWDEHGAPYLCIQPKVNPEKYPPFAVPVNDAWMYSRDHNKTSFHLVTMKAVVWMFDRWNIGMVTKERWASIASTIEDGIGDLLKAPPREKLVDLAVQQQLEHEMSEAVRNADVDGNTIKMAVRLSA